MELLLSHISVVSEDDQKCSTQGKHLEKRTSTGSAQNEDSAVVDRKEESSDVVTCLVENWKTKQLVKCVVTRVPQALPLNCASQQLHRWRNDDSALSPGGSEVYYGGRLKVVCSQGIVYRCVFNLYLFKYFISN